MFLQTCFTYAGFSTIRQLEGESDEKGISKNYNKINNDRCYFQGLQLMRVGG
jgi:hypothetical protein